MLRELCARVAPSERMILLRFRIPAPPSPWSALPTSSMPQDCAPAHKALPTMIQNSWNCMAEWRPKSSANWPDAGTKVVKVNVYAATIQLKLPESWSVVETSVGGTGVKQGMSGSYQSERI
jgi:hypothetical protein